MDYELTRHARDVLAERGISIAWVDRVLDSPEKVEPDREDASLEHRLACITERGGRVLRVILNKAERPVRIVTAYFDRGLRTQP